MDADMDVTVYPPEGTDLALTAQALLDGAASVGAAPSVVVFSDGAFVAPQSVVDASRLPEGADTADTATAEAERTGQTDEVLSAQRAAGVEAGSIPDPDDDEQSDAGPGPKAPAKKAAPRKAAAKKAAPAADADGSTPPPKAPRARKAPAKKAAPSTAE